MTTDSFDMIVSDGKDDINQQVDVFIDYTPVDAIIITGENQYLHNTALDLLMHHLCLTVASLELLKTQPLIPLN